VLANRHPLIEAAPGRPLPPLPRSAWIEVDLDAIVANARSIEASLPAGTRLNAVVKGDAYGHGAVAVARALVAAGIGHLGVATFDEAVELRQAAISVPILVLYPIPPELAGEAMRHCLSLAAGDMVLLDRTLGVLAGLSAAEVRPGARLPIHLEVETGLGRGGILPEDVPAAVAAIESSARARLEGMWSHLANAGDRERTAAQAARIGVAAGLLEATGMAVPDRHLAASGGVLAASAPAYDFVRIGLSLYGLIPDGLAADERFEAVAAGLRPAMALRARPVRVADLPTGTGVSYGPTFTTSRPSRIATLPLGYADGLPRSLSNRARVLVRGRRVPAVGTVAMDAVMVDVTDVPGAPVSVDDEFTLIGTQGGETIAATEVAQWGNTISYEIVTAMSGRLPRVYYAAAKAVLMRTVASDLGSGGEVGESEAAAGEEEPGPFGRE
jgi:alanine racemase